MTDSITKSAIAAPSSLADFSARAKKIIGDHIKSAILIDDYWPSYDDRVKMLTSPNDATDSEIEAEEEFEDEDSLPDVEAELNTGMPSIPTNNESEIAERLLRIQDCFTKKGIICTGFKYTQGEQKFAHVLAKNADIVVLDWNFAGDNGIGAVEILKALKDGQLRFICVFTDEPHLESIKKKIIVDACSSTFDENNSDTDFKVENFVFTLRNKTVTSVTSANASTEENLLDDAITHLAKHYYGFLQLAMLEMTSFHRSTLLSHLVRFSSEYDTALLSEASFEDSPLNLPRNLRALLIDEWKVALDSVADEGDMCLLGLQGRTAYAASLKVHSPKIKPEYLTTCIRALGIKSEPADINKLFATPQGSTQRKFDSDIAAWLDGGAMASVPSHRNLNAKDAVKMTVATLYALSHYDNPDQNPTQEKIYNHLFRLDALFNQQQLLPKELTQGTILKFDDENYLICITPLCDVARFKEGYSPYSFLGATKTSSMEMLGKASDYCVFLENDQPVCLHVNIKSPYVYEVGHEARVIALNTQVEMRHRHLPIKKSLPPCSEVKTNGVIPLQEVPPTVVEPHVAEVVSNENIAISTSVESASQKSDGRFIHTVVGQLRTDFFLMLTAASASNAVRVGVNRMEFIRSHKAA